MLAFLRRIASNLGVLGEVLQYLWKRKLWWLLPMVIVLILFGVVIMLGSSSGIGPFIYTLF